MYVYVFDVYVWSLMYTHGHACLHLSPRVSRPHADLPEVRGQPHLEHITRGHCLHRSLCSAALWGLPPRVARDVDQEKRNGMLAARVFPARTRPRLEPVRRKPKMPHDVLDSTPLLPQLA